MPQVLPQLQPLLEAGAGASLDLLQPVAALRATADAGVISAATFVRPVEGVTVADEFVAGVPVRRYLPTGADGTRIHVHLHGGGWWMGSVETTHPIARELAAASGLTVVSVSYRLAPESPFPAALDDVCAVLEALGSGQQPPCLSVGGESAGANLAAAAALRLRDTVGPPLVAQWLDVPALDLGFPDSPSLRDFGHGYGLDAEPMRTIVDWYCSPEQRGNPYVSPLRARDLSGLPPAIVTTAELDPVRDQGEAYAAALRNAGVPVRSTRASGHLHGTTWLTALTESAARWHDDVVRSLVELHERARLAAA